MSESDEIRLLCWVLGYTSDSRVFSVIIKRSAHIEDLKTAIKSRKSSYEDIPANSIDLYKFQLPLDDFDEDEAQSIYLEDGQELKSSNDVSFYWMEEPGEVLSIILPCPAGTTTPWPSQNSDLLLNPPPPWLVEIHSELWGRRDFFGRIFRTATVTKGDFTELQDLLDALNPERNSDEYVSEDVLATKSAFLRERSTGLDPDLVDGLIPRPVLGPCQPPSSDVVDKDGDVGDDDVAHDSDDDIVDNDDVVMDDNAAMVIDSDTHLPNEAMAIFPYTIRYVDLTVLQSKEKLRVPRLMLFGNEWGTMIDIFNEREEGTRGSALFSG